jgi:hypothetical protein
MSSDTADAPLTPDLPAPPGQEDVAAPDLTVQRPDDREAPDGTAVSGGAGTVEAPD